MVDDTKDAVIVIAENGLIQFTNRVMNKMFGYKKGELDGKNVSTIMPNVRTILKGFLRPHTRRFS